MSIWKIWCDGACAPTNPGPCAWGSVIESPTGERREQFGFIHPMGTNNKELWQALHREYQAREVTLEWVRGHNGHPENERADRLANQGLRSTETRSQ
ncbi:RNase H family protein [Acidithiobacillus ferridurans]|uniref:RNase H type-1 domain-containing protein n=1 Tax=Acidithiobacillus ferridurans TaxID=1232575 RepID=A0A8X8GAW4_ACIFI|nr:RNase H family protein [Acidithiobacillus ferridurans]MBU2714596.1 hypothetical protein [Acidithiobacillus ferridurans]MBU2723885.1 hypothetical protein [Acidithiobacillus ferridurans]MBU2726319.1 hypothetical protein [Acidithiobacillus ferridurans]